MRGEMATTDEVKEVDLNGVKGLMYDNSLDWEKDGVIYFLISLDNSITRDEMIKIAKSFKSIDE